MHNKPFAEIIESSLDTFTAQCWEWNTFPTFGSLIEVVGKTWTVFGCVTAIQTGSMDPLRYPFPYQKTEEELRAQQPQIFEFLKTTFTVRVLGYKGTHGTQYTLAPQPCKIHAFVKTATPDVTTEFFSAPDFLYLLFSSSASITHFDDLLLAIFSQLHTNKKLTNETLGRFCETLALLTGNDYRRIKLFLKRVGKVTQMSI